MLSAAYPNIANPALQLQARDMQESNFSSAFYYAAIGMALVSLQGHFLQVNRALCELTGYDDEELTALTFQDITHPEDLNTDLSHLAKLTRGEINSYRMEKRYLHKDGHLMWILLSVSLVCDTQGDACHYVSQMQDITERKQIETQLKEKQLEIKTLVENVPDIIVRYDTDLRVLFITPYIERVTGRKVEAFLGKTLEEAQSPASICQIHRESLKRVVATRQVVVTEYPYESPQGPLLFQMRMIPDESENNLASVLCVSHDVTRFRETQHELLQTQQLLQATNEALAKQNGELEMLAFYDSLTGIHNRRAFDSRLLEEMTQAVRHHIPFCLALLDIDHFKRFNDMFGHKTGDETLHQVARLLEMTVRPNDVVARYGGEEFALIFTHTNAEGGHRAAERCCQAIAAFNWPHAPVTVSVGIANWTNEDHQTLLERVRNSVC